MIYSNNRICINKYFNEIKVNISFNTVNDGAVKCLIYREEVKIL